MTAIEITFGAAGVSFEADHDGQLRQIGFRPLAGPVQRIEAGPFPPEAIPFAYPAWGHDDSQAPALHLTSADGRAGCYPVLDGYERAGDEHRIRLRDAGASLVVDLCLRASAGDGVLEQWVEVSHDQAGPVTLHAAAAAAPVLHAPAPWLTSFRGDWAAEWTPVTAPVPVGATTVESRGAVQPCLQASPFFFVTADGPALEETGAVLAGCLAWGGGIHLSFSRQVAQPQLLRVLCGQSPAGYVLDPGVLFATPRMIWAWSADGTRPLTHRLHRWVRDHVVRDGGRLRPVVFNTWEATSFTVNEAKLEGMMTGAADLGAELFLLDDGWFGTEFPRLDDRAGLGDWEADPARLPGGLGALTDAAQRRGLRFGLWVEPEMVNPASRLYRSHPDWVVSERDRPRREDRHQLVLDLCRPEVRDFVTGTVGLLLTGPAGSAGPAGQAGQDGISYLKWDANRDISEPGSAVLPADRQVNLWTDTVRARWQVMAAVAARWPDAELMLCAAGGGRTDLGTLRWFHEVWLSDNTDAVQRLRMQWHAAQFLPPQVIAAHVTRWGSQDLAFACAVAMSARFGFDLDPATLSPAEMVVCQRATSVYRKVRDLVQFGDLFRLTAPDSPGSNGRAALAFCDESRRRAVIFGYQLSAPQASGALKAASCPVPWAASDRAYRVRELILTRPGERVWPATGASLLAQGLVWPLTTERSAAIWLVETE